VLTDELVREALARAKERHSDRPGDGAELDEDDLED
jgi:ribosome maturation factor RimP